ncbi:MAG TPA: DUF4126 family protein [Roseiflexaceae bacterium]|jgi:uncharacterized membrane protein|nr:DUF4126 family protein [Roseiflexaceae bacterium]
MPSVQTTTLLRIIAFSALAGSRSMSPTALLSLYLTQRSSPPKQWIAQRLSSTSGAIITSTLALGELVADKLPQTPNRTDAPALIGRMISGGGVGALLGALHDQPAWLCAICGSVAAAAETFATFYLRRGLGQALPIPDPLIALLEDGLVWNSGWWLLASLNAEKDKA